MKHLIICCALLFPVAASAQTQEDTDKGYIVELIEGSLSGASRDVTIIGFQGALSSVATLDVLTVADVDGVWLTLEDVTLDWDRSALLTGRIEVSALRAERIIVARPPVSEASGPAPEATPFSLPDLPVGITLGDLDIAQIILGEAFLGEEIAFKITGNAALSGGEGNASITATRLGDKQGTFEINGGYSNETRILDLLLNLQEDRNGIAATLLGLPGAPSTALTISGTAPIDNYAAKITLSTDGTDRVAGDFELTQDDGGRLISLDIGGDVTPLFAPEYQSFFGDDTALTVLIGTGQNGEIDLRNLDLQSEAIQLTGTAQIGAQGWPERLNLRGQIKGDNGDLVLLPLSGPKTYVDGATFLLGYDGALSDDWSIDVTLDGLDRPGILLRQVNLTGGGKLVSGEGSETGSVSAQLRYQVQGIDLDDAAISEALGTNVSGVLNVTRIENEPTRIERLTINGPGLELVADATLSGLQNGLRVNSNAVLSARDIARFSALAGRPLSGAADIAISSTIVPLDGAFDLIVTGTTQDLAVGIAQADALLAGTGDIAIAAKRDTQGTRLETLNIRTDAVTAKGTADLKSDGSVARFDIIAADISMIEPSLRGAASISGTADQNADGLLKLNVTGDALATSFEATADVNPTPTGQTVNFDTTASISDLSAYAGLVGQQIAGGAQLSISGALLSDGQRFSVDVSGETDGLALGIPQIDPLLRGDGVVSVALARTGADQFRASDLLVKTDGFSISGDASGNLSGAGTAQIRAQVNDASILGQGLSGMLSATVDANRDASGVATVTADVDGPATQVNLNANINADNAVTGTLQADIGNLAAYRTLIGQPVSGGVSARISGDLQADLSSFDVDVDATTSNIGIGNRTVDQLIGGAGRLQGNVQLDGGRLTVNDLDVSSANVTLRGDLGGASGTGRGAFSARLRDVGIFTDQLSGPIDATGTAALDGGGNWAVDAQADGPGGIAVRANGQVGANGRLNLNATGQAPLGLANRIIEPRRISGDATFDLNVNGQPNLNAVSGRVDLRNAQLTAPTLGQGLSNIVGGITLGNGRAQVAVTADVKSGGTIAVRGPVTLASPQTADVAITLDDVILKDPELYETSISGQVTVKGPVQGGARIAGNLNLGQTDVQVPSSGVGALGDLPNVTHIGANGAVKTTLDRAGVSVSGALPAAARNTSVPFPLDITINAPSRIFIRGRGLDAELGGTLKIGGTTNNIQPVGLFELTRGRIDILQQRFELTEGSASLQGDFEPYIRLVATTQARTGTTISIIVEGPATAPEVSFTSVPSLPQDEVLSQLIFGRDLQNISPLQAVQLAAAVGTLAGRGGGGLIDTFRQNVGLDDFDVTTDEDGNAAVRAGKYLSENVYTDVTVSSDGSTEINLNLDITDEITAKGTVDADGETSIGIFFERDY